MATASHIDENCKQLSQVPTKTVRNQKEDWVAEIRLIDWAVLRPLQHSIGYMGDGFYRSKDPTTSI